MINNDKYFANIAIPPSETLLEVLESLNMTQKELAKRIGMSVKTINEIIKGKAPITAETALKLEIVLDTPASFWINLESNYREALARIKIQLRSLIPFFRALTLKEPREVFEVLAEKCRECGVALVLTQLIPKTSIDGATQWISSEKALIQLSDLIDFASHFFMN